MDHPEPMQRSLRGLAAALEQEHLAELPSFAGFPPVDAEEMAQGLDLYVRAAETGQRGDPPRTAKLPDEIETEIGTVIERVAGEAVQAYSAQLAQHDAQIRRTFLTDAEGLELEASCRILVEELDGPIRDTQARLMGFWRERVEPVQAEFEDFRTRNALERPPKLVSGGEKTIRLLILAALTVLGVVVHGLFLGGPSDRMLRSVLWSLFNVGAAIGYARLGFPGLVGRGFRSKLSGVVATSVFVSWTLGVNLLAAHHREVWVANEGNAAVGDLWNHLSIGPFAVDASLSWLLATLGLAWSTMAALAAVGLDDVYPGYGAIGRRQAAAHEEYRIETAICSEVLADLQKAADADLRATMEAVQGREQESTTAAAARTQFYLEYLEVLDQLASAYDQLCSRYREINSAVRDGKVPAYFKREVKRPKYLADPGLPPQPQPPVDWNHSIERLQHHAKLVASLIAEARPRAVEDDTPEPERDEAEALVEITVGG
jgi:hypothetical protein